MYSRWQETKIVDALKTRRVIVLSGPRQCGKTTLAETYSKDGNIYRTLDDVSMLQAAISDPHGFVNHGNELMVIDEIQRAPILLQAIKMDVDRNQNKGRFLLTGSANIQSLPSVQESLAGRVRHLRLRALAQGEIENTEPRFLTKVLSPNFSPSLASSQLNKNDYINLALLGGYPEPRILEKQHHKDEWFHDYVESIIQKDLKDIANIKKTDAARKLLTILAAWSSRFIDWNSIGSSLNLTNITLVSYVNSLEMLYLIERIPAWTKTAYDRVSKRDKLFMSDTGMLSSLLHFTPEKIMFDGLSTGLLLETFICQQLLSLIEAQENPYKLFHYRDKDKREIDFLIENEDGKLLGIEVKAGSNVGMNDFKHLHWFKQHINSNFIGIVLYTGEHAIPMGEGFWVIPISHLWG